MFDNESIRAATAVISENNDRLRALMISETVEQLIEVTERFAPGETEFDVAIYVEGPYANDGHSLIFVEERLIEIMVGNHAFVDAMRDSPEFDNEWEDDVRRAARALVNEALPEFESRWNEKHSSSFAP